MMDAIVFVGENMFSITGHRGQCQKNGTSHGCAVAAGAFSDSVPLCLKPSHDSSAGTSMVVGKT